MNYYERAKELHEDLIRIRRHIHQNAECGMDMPMTAAFVKEELKKIGCEPVEICPHTITATIGKGEKTILLRADMDALPMMEESGLDFAATNGNAHACGHDMHATGLLGAARMLKENEANLPGKVKLFFQPGEEVFKGAEAAVAAGIMEGVDAALGVHVSSTGPVGVFCYNDSKPMMASCDGFRITITGKSTHGSMPHTGIDPINIGVHIYLALQELIAREVDPAENCVLTLGKFQGGTANNIIPDTAVLEGTLRTLNPEVRKYLVGRISEVAKAVAATYRGTVEIEALSSVPPLVLNTELTKQSVEWIKQLPLPMVYPSNGVVASASEDFAIIAEKVPSAYFFLCAQAKEGPAYNAHNAKVVFNEDVLPFASSILAHCATEWLKANA